MPATANPARIGSDEPPPPRGCDLRGCGCIGCSASMGCKRTRRQRAENLSAECFGLEPNKGRTQRSYCAAAGKSERKTLAIGWRGSWLGVGAAASAPRNARKLTPRAEAIVRKALAAVRWREIDLALQPKGHPVKASIARQLRTETPMS
jgi:hypothetical protein